MKRLLSFFLMTAILLTVLSACSSGISEAPSVSDVTTQGASAETEPEVKELALKIILLASCYVPFQGICHSSY